MKFAAASLALMATSVIAAPVEKRAVTDADILNYALTLEHLEATFYAQAVAKYTAKDFSDAGFGGNFYKNLNEIAMDEATHVSFLTGALKAAGYPAVAACSYDFGYSTPAEFVQVASILEGVGISAYLGAASLIMDKTYLTAAGSILTVESRHNAYLRSSKNPPQSPFPQPFDVPLDLDQVYSLAVPFITGCPMNQPKLPVQAFPVLSLAPGTGTPVRMGDKAKFEAPSGTTLPSTLYAAFITVTGPVFAPATVASDGKSVTIATPKTMTIAGQSYVVFGTSATAVSDDTTKAVAIIPVLTQYLDPLN